ncbi:DMT family transporter [Erysipelothrix rhusiopathiae]|uniref:DMT family transporter n=1 Tax=Erysipelothrix rhusiopathiae TaxID=1648 RepID=UPI001EE005A1|nr:DMT family transporter [Erysipelothrix rhusiopathiae]MCG4457220.1 DMT family transporter [Erysipelothrix rhusiopathiae]MDE8032669.1 DMT family transporter [Erysipelothrix rhusiopathiae]MDE8035908.1 DMT family transporter [Erysipelothrix rhusiopathiae]MDE8043479.1 DMT family transporter [Erysipelothrix rhusiopathiae]MDE8050793.1 DMT family transporter [Erysipelothrix rhusiopathiae]
MRNKGTITGLFSGLFWGLDTVMIGVVLASTMFLAFGSNAPLISTFIHDGASFLFLLILIVIQKQGNDLIRVLFSRSGMIIAIAALLGGPIGMGAYILSINHLGPAISASISAIYPLFGAVLSFIILKEKPNKRTLLGLLIAISAIVLMGFTGSSGVINLQAGLFFISVCIIGWGSEAVIISTALKQDVPSHIALAIRQLVSFLTYGLIIMPLIGYSQLQFLVVKHPIFLMILISGIIGSISYSFYYKSISLIGPSKAMGLNISYPAWAFLFQFMVDHTFNYKNFILVIFIMIGSILSSENPRELIELFRRKK